MRPVRRIVVLLACLAALAVAGCGGDSSSGGAGAALEYVPADTPFAVTIDTDLEGEQYESLDSIVNRFPGADAIKGLLKAQLTLGQEGVDFDKDIKPLLGNPAVVSATDVTSFVSNTDESGFVAALEVKDKDALDSLIEKTGAEKQGEVAGATEYQDSGTYFAVDDDVVVLAGSKELLEAALKRAEDGNGLSEDDFDKGLEGLPDDALARVYVDVQKLLAQSSDGKAAQKIEWVGALRTLGLTLSAHKDSIDAEFNLKTEGDLSDEDLPVASGDEAANVIQRPGEIGVGLRDPGQLVTFFESALQAVDPDSYGDYEQGKRALSAKLDLDIDRDLIGQLTGNLSVSATIDGEFGVRAEVKDPEAVARSVDKIAKSLPDFGLGDDVTRTGDLYTVRGDVNLVFGVVNGALVVANDPARARSVATATPESVEGANGSLVLRADAEGIARQVIAQFAPRFGIPDPVVPILARPFDELRGSVTTSTDGMKGKFSLTLD